MARIRFRFAAFEEIRRSPEVECVLQREVDSIAGRVGPGGYAHGVSSGRSRSRGYVVTTDYEAIRDNAKNHTLLRALGGSV